MAEPACLRPLVSICLPVYNGEAHLAEAVGSILAQTYTNLELLVFDDASTDESCAWLRTVQDPRLTLRRNERNLGPEANWNQALAAAQGKYIKLFHQDDLLVPQCLEAQVQALESRPEAVLTFCSRTIIHADGRRFMKRQVPWPDGPLPAADLVAACIKAGTNLIGEPSAVLFRRDASARAGGFDGSIPYLIDLDYWVRLMAYGDALCLQAALVSFRLSCGQWSATIGRQQSRQFITFLEKLRQTRVAPGWPALLRGRLMARANGLLRALVYRCLVGTKP